MANPEQFRIRITKTPEGPAPEDVRNAWVGLEFSAYKMPPRINEVDFVSGRPIQNRGGYLVPTKEALDALEQSSPVAAGWFRLALPEGMPSLTFGLDEAEIVPQEEAEKQ
ncbi:MAG: hypothetical protein A3C30_03700 [Candidatus Levybacteria bacterium RIFCSPHIGHO2_02_FULL_40_18]|nr:MAG: hypothetical protein A2869_00275 [Candidatus Levybacteria bacterium RIFCSPHIGHO2_01_FULL_40_58]OGH26190.1 MAG: hypothetical protein A3C30_03700 [Candidatus Levybacteria bacterium RIFCSPHIGHO2_02_FULL_40_18]OGH31356.1 MAG: hypothetical protein A3E43_03220 [Candidatus Levybacteria bacterium RIFCSPHIGHO2_12_FULL_40_31]OGH40073.1 MAG: hypothetical protein A2894_04015 [Candidatus Levybacteria bacterium RIFCSPLOWO2_01_FULL_40_64]OGH49036.1 MAG: hypothetical protein A3I54_00480 [Candidatus Lev